MAEQAKLQDMLSYTPEQYYTDEEMKLIRKTFKDNPELLKVLRKTFIPTITDPELPLEEMAKDAMLAGKNWSQVPEMEKGKLVTARQDAIQFVAGGLIFLKNVANLKEETEEERQRKAKQNSNK